MDNFFAFAAQYLFIGSFLLSAIYFFKLPADERISLLIRGAIAAAIAYCLAILAGQLYYNPRPFVVGHFKPLIAHDTENGFPSDHILLLTVIAIIWTLQTRKLWTLWLWAIMLIVAYARVYAGVHHYLDVVTSMLIAISAAVVTFMIIKGHILDRCVAIIKNLIAKITGSKQKGN